MNNKVEYFKNKTSKINIYHAKLTCYVCARKFQSEDELKNHEDMFHTRYNCENCPYISFGKKDINQHKNLQHKHTIQV